MTKVTGERILKSMHEEDFWSSWLREDERGKEERTAKAEKNQEGCFSFE